MTITINVKCLEKHRQPRPLWPLIQGMPSGKDISTIFVGHTLRGQRAAIICIMEDNWGQRAIFSVFTELRHALARLLLNKEQKPPIF